MRVTGSASAMPTRARAATTTPADLPEALVVRHCVNEAFQPAVRAADSAVSQSGLLARLDSCPTTKSADVVFRKSSMLLQPSGLTVSMAQLPSVRCC